MQVVCAYVRAAEGHEAELEQVLRSMIAPTLEEPGCHTYALHRRLDDPRSFFFYEAYSDEDAFQAHTQTPHFTELGPKLAGLVEGEAQIVLYEPLG